MKKYFKIFSILCILFISSLFLFGRFYVNKSKVQKNQYDQQASVQSSSFGDTKYDKLFLVSRVVDGDTIEVVDQETNKKEKVRLIGVNTPETVDPRKKVECFGHEASLFLKNILSGKEVGLVSDLSQSDRDKYGRLLRYVYLGDTLVNQEIIQSGYGYEYTYDIPYKFRQDFKSSEDYARVGGIGLWATTTCSGKL